jgi:hypothetical protein
MDTRPLEEQANASKRAREERDIEQRKLEQIEEKSEFPSSFLSSPSAM